MLSAGHQAMGIMNEKELQQDNLYGVLYGANIDTNRIAGAKKAKKTYPPVHKRMNVTDQGDKRKQ